MVSKLLSLSGVAGMLVMSMILPASSSPGPNSDAGAVNNGMTNFGSVDGKTFLGNVTLAWEWDEAQIFCNKSGRQFATITTDAQAELIRAAFPVDNKEYLLWIGAYHHIELSQFKWDISQQTPRSVLPYSYYARSRSCLAVSVKNPLAYFTSANINDNFGVLCEQSNGVAVNEISACGRSSMILCFI